MPTFIQTLPHYGMGPFQESRLLLIPHLPLCQERGENLSIEALWKKLQAEEPRSHQYQQGQGQEKTVEVTLFCRYCRAA